MKGQHNSLKKFHPVRVQKKYLRTVREKKRCKSENGKMDSVKINLKDLGDVDVKELNTIPSSISEDASWQDKLDLECDVVSPCPNPLLQVSSGQFCTMCTAELVKIHGNDSGTEICSVGENEQEMVVKARSFLEQNVMNMLTGLDKVPGKSGLQVFKRDYEGKISLKKQDRRIARDIESEGRITCSMSKVSMQACLSNSDSTVSAVISEAVQTPPSMFQWSTSSDEKVIRSSLDEGKLKLLCGEILMQLCKATAGSSLKSGAAAMEFGGNQISSEAAEMQEGQRVDSEKKISKEELLTSQTGVQQSNEPKQEISAVKLKTPSNTFKPVLCTKLSMPWRVRKHSSYHVSHGRPHVKHSAVLPKTASSSMATEQTKSQELLLTDGKGREKTNKEDAKRKNKELKEHFCPNCKSSLQSIYRSAPISTKTKPAKKDRGYKRWSPKRHRPISKERRTKRRHHSKLRSEAAPKLSDTKYFIKSFFTGTSSDTMPKSKSNEKPSRGLLVKPYHRRKKSTFTLPHDVTVGQAGVNLSKKKPDDDRQLVKHKSKETDLLTSKELKMISKHVKAHEKRASDTPMFHTCFKHILSRELKNKGIHGRKHQIMHKDNLQHKKAKENVSGLPQKWEKRKFNDSLFSCLIPRVFK